MTLTTRRAGGHAFEPVDDFNPLPVRVQEAVESHVVTRTGSEAYVFTTNESKNLKAGVGKVGHIAVWDAGTAWVLDVYDALSNANQVWQWVTADGKGIFAIQMPMSIGVRVVTSGTTPGSATVVWE